MSGQVEDRGVIAEAPGPLLRREGAVSVRSVNKTGLLGDLHKPAVLWFEIGLGVCDGCGMCDVLFRLFIVATLRCLSL